MMIRIRPYSKKEMIDLGADGHLQSGYARYIPIDRLDGLEPVPTNNESEDGDYHPGKRIAQPIEVAYDEINDVYMVYGGNHRIAQAKANGQTHVLAFIEPDMSSRRPYIGKHPLHYDPDYSLFEPEAFSHPSQEEIVQVLRSHKLINLKEKVMRAFIVGSFAKGTQNRESDVDILLEVEPNPDWDNPRDLEDHYRHALRQFFVTNNIRGKMDSVHPQWKGRRVDVYVTYDADLETRPKIALETNANSLRNGKKP